MICPTTGEDEGEPNIWLSLQEQRKNSGEHKLTFSFARKSGHFVPVLSLPVSFWLVLLQPLILQRYFFSLLRIARFDRLFSSTLRHIASIDCADRFLGRLIRCGAFLPSWLTHQDILTRVVAKPSFPVGFRKSSPVEIHHNLLKTGNFTLAHRLL